MKLLATFHKYSGVFRVHTRESVVYVANFATRNAQIALRVWIYAQLYRTVFAAGGTPLLAGMTHREVVWSLMLTQCIGAACAPKVVTLIEHEVKSGALAYSLCRPYSFVLFHLVAFFGRASLQLVANIAIGCTVAWLCVGGIDVSWQAGASAAACLILGLSLECLMNISIGLIALWVEDVSSIHWLFHKGGLVFGGMIVPLALLPEHVGHIAELSPFAVIFHGPARLVTNFDLQLWVRVLAVQLVWIALMAACTFTLFVRGIKHVSVNGG
jgi:ABC-2 type transport system permease protein